MTFIQQEIYLAAGKKNFFKNDFRFRFRWLSSVSFAKCRTEGSAICLLIVRVIVNEFDTNDGCPAFDVVIPEMS
jgi:hypothetical protein